MADTVPAVTVAKAVLDYINTMAGIPVTARFGELDDRAPAISMQGEAGAVKDKEYINGSYRARYAFKVLYKVQGSSTAEGLAADKVLVDIGAHLEAATSVSLGTGRTLDRMEMTSFPEHMGITDSGQAVHGADYQLIYKQT